MVTVVHSPKLIALVLTPAVTGSISFTASITIIIMIFRSELKLSTVYRRLVVGISFFDVIQSISQALSTLPMPANPLIWGSSGNDTSCDLQGFLTVVGVSGALLYSLSISIYFLAIIKFQKSESYIKKYVEPYLHIIPILYSLFGGIYLYATEFLNPAGTMCWIAPEPPNCNKNEEIECISQGNYTTMVTLFAGGLVIVALVANVLAIGIIWWTEYSISTKNLQKYQNSWQQTSFAVSHENSRSRNVPPSPLVARLSRPSKASVRRRREIANRACAYIICFLITYMPAFVYRLWSMTGVGAPFALTLITRICFPLQGVFNIIVYTYPHVVSYRRTHTCSWFRAFWEVIKSGGDSDTTKSRSTPSRKNRLSKTALSLRRRKSMRNEPVVLDLEDLSMVNDTDKAQEELCALSPQFRKSMRDEPVVLDLEDLSMMNDNDTDKAQELCQETQCSSQINKILANL